MAITQVSICNLALDMISASPIVAMEDVNPRAEACSRNYEAALRDCLRAHPWNFAHKRAVLVKDAAAPIFEWAYRYPLPADFVALYQVNGVTYSDEPGEYYEIEDTWLLTDENAADIQYVSYATTPAAYPGDFVTVFATLLASRIAAPLRQDGQATAVTMEQLYDRRLTKAKTRDSNERKARRYDPASESRFLAARWWGPNFR